MDVFLSCINLNTTTQYFTPALRIALIWHNHWQ